jgi:hypothetical protein
VAAPIRGDRTKAKEDRDQKPRPSKALPVIETERLPLRTGWRI